MMAINVIFRIFTLLHFQFTSSVDSRQPSTWFAYLNKTLSLAHKHSVSMHMTTDIITHLFHNFDFFDTIWNRCLVKQSFTETKEHSLHGNDIFLNFPCLKGKFVRGNLSFTCKIEVQRSFQVKLTFVQFSISWESLRCDQNKIMVTAHFELFAE